MNCQVRKANARGRLELSTTSGADFRAAKENFDATIGKGNKIANSPVPVNGKNAKGIPIVGKNGQRLEEYYKWQFIYALIDGGLYPRDNIGVEVHFPKGSKGARALELDAAIFDDPKWIDYYLDFWKTRNTKSLEWLAQHLVVAVEFKRAGKNIESAYLTQLRPAIKEKEPADAYALGVFYDQERLFLFSRRSGAIIRYDDDKNLKGLASQIGDLSLDLPDPYSYLPTFKDVLAKTASHPTGTRANRSINDLDTITSISSPQIKDAFSHVLRTLDSCGLVDQRGYALLIQAFAMKIFDENRSRKYPKKTLQFYIDSSELTLKEIGDADVQRFIARMKAIYTDAEPQYHQILRRSKIDWTDLGHMKTLAAVCYAFQDFSFVRSNATDLYSVVFYNFAHEFTRDESAQFLTPLPVIDFIVALINPNDGESIIDPCCGIGDFLSVAFLKSQGAGKPGLDDANIFGLDRDENMIILATLNMLLNGDGQAKLQQRPEKGALLWKYAQGNPPAPVALDLTHNKGGSWDGLPDGSKILKFDIVLTNPPFGEDRSYRVVTSYDRDVAELYETWQFRVGADKIDLGVLFLENAVRLLKAGGRFAIVLSNSLASISRWEPVRRWLIENIRLVATFDLPSNVFAETGVNTTILVGYKPAKSTIKKLISRDYEVFTKDIRRVGYEKRTSKRNVFFNKVYKTDPSTFEIAIDADGNPLLDEEFTETLAEFRQWVRRQETELKNLFPH